MSDDVIKMLRYNTGTDKKAFIKLKDNFDAVIFNATIVAYSGSAVSDLVSVYKNHYIIDPQTHILQHDIMAIMSKNKKTNEYSIKKSVRKYLERLPEQILEILDNQKRPLNIGEIHEMLDVLVTKVYDFETEYVNGFIKEKEYDKYLAYADIGPKPKVIIAPYFMLKKDMAEGEKQQYMELNRKGLEKFIGLAKQYGKKYPIGAQLVMDKGVLRSNELIEYVHNTYDVEGYEYIFVWINDFSSVECSREEKEAFMKLIFLLNEMGKKPLMAYGGYDSILLSHEQMSPRLYGAAQSVGYGEARTITPVGGGMPVNKYYFAPLHKRMNFNEALMILMEHNFFSQDKSSCGHAQDYYEKICNCDICREKIHDDIDNFQVYNESTPYIVNARYGEIKRNRPTTEATFLAALHFLHCKNTEWEDVESKPLPELIEKLNKNFMVYATKNDQMNIQEWCEIFAG